MHTSLQLAIGLFYASVTAFSPNSLSHQLSHPTYQSCTHPTITTTTNAPTTTTREQSKQYKSTHSKWKMNIFQDFITNQISKYDEKKESNRKFRTTVYGAADWRRHRSSGRHFAELRNMPFSNILRGVFPQSLSVTLFAGFICLYNRALELNPSLRAYLPLLAFPGLPFSLMSPSLGLLLVFRTNTAYSRWKDSRVAWSSISSKSFNLMRQASSYFNDKKCILDLIKYTVVFTTSVKWHLGSRSDQDELKEELNGILSRAELEDFLRAKNKPQKAILEITSIIKRAELISSIQSHMDKGVCELSDCFYTCDRIYSTPIPLFYTRHTARFLLLWLLTIPMALYNELKTNKLAVIPISSLNALFLFGIEELGVQIEEPFSILALGNICNDIKTTADEILKANNMKWNEEFPVQLAAVDPIRTN